MFFVRISIKKGAGGHFLCYSVFFLLFPTECFLCTLLRSRRDKLEFLSQILDLRRPIYVVKLVDYKKQFTETAHLFLQDVLLFPTLFLVYHCGTDNGTSNLICFSIL